MISGGIEVNWFTWFLLTLEVKFGHNPYICYAYKQETFFLVCCQCMKNTFTVFIGNHAVKCVSVYA